MPNKGVALVKVITKTLERESKNNLHDLYPQTFYLKKYPIFIMHIAMHMCTVMYKRKSEHSL